MKTVALSTGLGEVMAPQTLVTVLVLSPDGTITIEPGALHGRSAIESSLRLVQKPDQVPDATVWWMVWVAVELDAANTPVRYKGVAVSELWVDPSRQVGCKVLAESVNRMAEAMRGGVNLKTLDAKSRALLQQQLASLSPEAWERSAPSLKEALR